MAEDLRIMVVAGEPSGDAHAAALVRALQAQAESKTIAFFGATGPLLRAAGVESIVDSDALAILGILEVGRALPKFWRAFRALKRAAIEQQPAAVILVDWPEFNLRLTKALHRKGLRTIYYISPQVWAWRSYRVHQIRRDVDLLLSILPFEADWFHKHGMAQLAYVGHPLAGEVRARYGREEFCRRHDLDSSRPVVALLPGSRHKELVRILPPLLDAATILAGQHPAIQFVLVVAPSRSPSEAEQIVADHKQAAILKAKLRIVHHETREALAAADAAAVASGTATLEATLLGTPMVIVYKESAINWHTLGSLITAEHYGLANLIAEERIVTELIQNELNGARLAAELNALLNGGAAQTMRAQLQKVAERLGNGGASERAATLILKSLEAWRPGSAVTPMGADRGQTVT